MDGEVLVVLGRIAEAGERKAACEERVAAALERLMEGWANAGHSLVASRDRETPKERAVRLLIQMGVQNITAVAKAAAVHPKTLYKWPETNRVIQRLRAIEAWEVRNPRAVRHDEL